MDKLIVGEGGTKCTISNDGATIIKLLEVVHPAARILVDIATSQDAEVGDGTTSVVLLAGELMRLSRPFIEDGMNPQLIIRGFRKASELCAQWIKDNAEDLQSLSQKMSIDTRGLLIKCAQTSMNSKLIHGHKDFFSEMVVDAVMLLEGGNAGLLDKDGNGNGDDHQHTLSMATISDRMIGVKKISGGAMEESLLIEGVAFEKTFAYAGFEQQPKSFRRPRVLLLNMELELKAERDNAEVRVENVDSYDKIVDAEWDLLFGRLQKMVDAGAQVILSKLAIGDVATQWFADRNCFAAGRVSEADMDRLAVAMGLKIQSSVEDFSEVEESFMTPENEDDVKSRGQQVLGECELFEERVIGDKKINIFKGCHKAPTCTLILRGGSGEFMAEVERSLHDAIMVVRRAIRTGKVVGGGGAIEMALAKHLRDFARSVAGRIQLVMLAFSQALEVIPRQLCENGGLDATSLLTQLRKRHSTAQEPWAGLDMAKEAIVSNNLGGDGLVWEPAMMKSNLIAAACEAASTILSIDLTISSAGQDNKMQSALPGVDSRGNVIGGGGGQR